MDIHWRTAARFLRRVLGPAIVMVLLIGLVRVPLEQRTTRHQLMGQIRSLARAERYFHEGNGRFFGMEDLRTSREGGPDVYQHAFGELGYSLDIRMNDQGQTWEALIWNDSEVYRVTTVPALRVFAATVDAPGRSDVPDLESLDWKNLDTTIY